MLGIDQSSIHVQIIQVKNFDLAEYLTKYKISATEDTTEYSSSYIPIVARRKGGKSRQYNNIQIKNLLIYRTSIHISSQQQEPSYFVRVRMIL